MDLKLQTDLKCYIINFNNYIKVNHKIKQLTIFNKTTKIQSYKSYQQITMQKKIALEIITKKACSKPPVVKLLSKDKA